MPEGSSISNITGSIDLLRNGFIAGWAIDRSSPSDPVVIEVWLDQDLLCTTRADEFRQDLTKLGNGDGRHAFHAAIAEVSPDQYTNLVVRVKSANGDSTATLMPAAHALGKDPLTDELRKLLPATNELKAQLRSIARAQEKILASLTDSSAKTRGLGSDPLPGSLANLEIMLEALGTTQISLQEHATATEVFLLRFDKMLADLGQRITQLSQPSGLGLLRWTLGVSLAVIILLTFGLIGMASHSYLNG